MKLTEVEGAGKVEGAEGGNISAASSIQWRRIMIMMRMRRRTRMRRTVVVRMHIDFVTYIFFILHSIIIVEKSLSATYSSTLLTSPNLIANISPGFIKRSFDVLSARRPENTLAGRWALSTCILTRVL